MHALALAAIFAAPLSDLTPPGLGDLETYADDVTLDTERRELELRGHVTVGASPFHLRSDALRLRRTGRGVEIEGEGKLAFCPCLGTPLTLSFHDAIVAPPSDLILRSPRLEIYGVPVMWLPYFWLRAPDRPGLLPPELSYRGKDGVFVGAGAHLPWTRQPRAENRELGFDLRAGGYLKGGYAIDGDLRTPSSRTKIRWDWLRAGGLAVDARGAAGDHDGVAWDVATMRGARAVAATRSLDEAAQPLDRSRVEGAVRPGPVTIASAATILSRRGSEGFDAHAGGPIALVSAGAPLANVGTFDGAARGGTLRDPERRTLSFAEAEVHAGVRRPLGIFAAAVDARGEAAVASNGEASGRFATARGAARLGLPLVRGFASADPSDPWRHRIEPNVAGSYVVEAQSGEGAVARGVLPTFLSDPDGQGARQLVVPEGGVTTAFGRFGARDGAELDVRGGYTLGDVRAPIVRARLAAGGELVGASAESGARLGTTRGVALTSRVRVGREDGLRVEARAGGRGGVDPTLARALAPALREAPVAWFGTSGFSAGGALVVPWTPNVTTRGGADVDLSTGTLLGVRGSVDLRDGCGCVTLRLFGSERIGREGVDVWLALELGEPGTAAVKN